MTPFVAFTVPVAPLPKRRARHGQGRTYTDPVTAQYEDSVRLFARRAMAGKVRNDADDLAAVVVFRLTGAQRVDIDNLVKSLFDAFNKIVWKDDSQVVDLRAVMRRSSSTPGTDVQIGIA